jgi:tryptophan-rich sensory protein
MAISLLLVLQRTSFFSKPVFLFMAQMVFNLAWTPLFFKYKLARFALVDLLLLVLVLVFTIRAFYNIKPIAAYLLLPYLAWLGLAGYLNTYIVLHN